MTRAAPAALRACRPCHTLKETPVCRLPLILLALALFPAVEAAELARRKGAWKASSIQVGKKPAVRLRAAEWSITFAGTAGR